MYGPEKITGCSYVLVVIDNFSKFGWTVPLKRENAQTIKDSFEKIPITSERKPKLIGTEDGKEFVNKISSDFSKKNNIKISFEETSLGAIFVECLNRTIRGR